MKRFSRPIYLKCAIVFGVNLLGVSFHRLSPAVSRFAVVVVILNGLIVRYDEGVID